MRFLKRDWTDAEKWGMGILSTLIVAGIVGLWASIDWSDPLPEKTKIALVAGYDSAVAYALNSLGEDTTRIRAEIDTRLDRLGIENVIYPAEPGEGDPPAVGVFAAQVIGILTPISEAQTCAFQLGFLGLMETNTPGTYPKFSIHSAANCAGFPRQKQQTDEQYLLELVQSARG